MHAERTRLPHSRENLIRRLSVDIKTDISHNVENDSTPLRDKHGTSHTQREHLMPPLSAEQDKTKRDIILQIKEQTGRATHSAPTIGTHKECASTQTTRQPNPKHENGYTPPRMHQNNDRETTGVQTEYNSPTAQAPSRQVFITPQSAQSVYS